MSVGSSFLTVEAYTAHENQLKTIFNREAELPSAVFKQQMRSFRFIDFDLSLSGAFVGVLRELALRFGDDSCVVAAVDPDPVAYYLEQCGRIGAFRLAREASRSEYWSLLSSEPPDSGADALSISSRIIAWTSSSSRWAIWGERESEIGVLGATESLSFLDGFYGETTLEIAADMATCFRRPFPPFDTRLLFEKELISHYQDSVD